MAPPANFVVFILTHERSQAVRTYATLLQQGYTGPLYLVIDNEDTQAAHYYAAFGDAVLMFDKAAIAATFDEGDNFHDRRAVIYARNACFALATRLGYTYFIQLDDDYQRFSYVFDDKGGYLTHQPNLKSLDTFFAYWLDFYQRIPASAIAFMQTGDLLGGAQGGYTKTIRTFRKAMNSFLCSTERPFQFVGRINEDVNTYTWRQSLGAFFLSINNVVLQQESTQGQAGGMTELYLDSGTYVKSFYTVMYQPSSVKITLMQSRHPRLHHSINWATTVPCILAETHCKAQLLG